MWNQTIPTAPAAALPESSRGKNTPGSPYSERPGILVVDDEPTIRNLVQATLSRAGFQVHVAADGANALRIYRSRQRQIAVVLVDVRMPGQDGPEVLRELRRLNPQVRCCFMSGELGRYSEHELQELGAAVIFRKPFRLADLTTILWLLAVSASGKRKSTMAMCGNA